MSHIALIRPPDSGIIRVYGRHYDPFAPVPWSLSFGPDGRVAPLKNRFDDIGPALGLPVDACFRTIYAASSLQAAFGELLASRRPSPRWVARLGEQESGEALLSELLGTTLDPMHPTHGVVPAEWRLRRRIASAQLRANAWFIDVDHPATLTHLRAEFLPGLKRRYPGVFTGDDFDLSDVASRNRELTQHVARYLHELEPSAFNELEAGGVIAGIRYLSRHSSSWECWALFADRVQEGMVVRLPQEIGADNGDLLAVARHFDLSIQLGEDSEVYIRPWMSVP